MLTVCCVEVNDYQGCGERYVRILRDSVARNLGPHRFVCLSDRVHSGVETVLVEAAGWWSKVAAFAPGLFEGRVLYLDLDNIITGSLDELAEHKGIIHLTDWGWKDPVYGSGVMVWDAGEHAEIWERFTPDVPARLRGDQDWMTELGGWERLPPGICRSYRYECKAGPPPGTRVVCTHGPKDKPHLLSGWVRDYWRD